ncbi:Asp Glu hydantoin racemase protein [Venturia nashicola]|nr:Asp Glu hydantoin racemase protein [Venturia nashicola]
MRSGDFGKRLGNMVGQLANRAQFGLILPSTNTSVEAEFNRMLVPGVSWHSGRIWIKNPDLSTSEAMVAFLANLRNEMQRAVESCLHAKVDYFVMGMSAETFWGGKDGASEFVKYIKDLSGGLDVTTGAAACGKVMETYKVKNIGVITPYQPVGDEEVVRFFEQIGCVVLGIYGMKCATATSIADVTGEEIKDAFRRVDNEEVELLIQAGTNLCAGKACAELEVELGKPVLAINTFSGWGSLFEKY